MGRVLGGDINCSLDRRLCPGQYQRSDSKQESWAKLASSKKWKTYMYRLFFSIACIMSIISAASAAEWKTRESDEILTRAKVAAIVSGKALTYESGQKSVFRADGAYEYHVGGKVYKYQYSITEDGAICIVSANYGARCDLIVESPTGLQSINEKGERFGFSVK
jgi:hypothetical protein